MKRNIINTILALIITTGCVHYRPIAVSTNPVGTQYEQPVGIAKGISKRSYVFCIIPVGDNSMAAAWANALEGTDGDTLSNVIVERKLFYFYPFLIQSDTHVSGTVVKYKKGDGEATKKASEERIAPEDQSIWKPKPIEKQQTERKPAKPLTPEEQKEKRINDVLQQEMNRWGR